MHSGAHPSPLDNWLVWLQQSVWITTVIMPMPRLSVIGSCRSDTTRSSAPGRLER